MYGKLFTQMYEGTLASRGPWEALVTFQQLIILANKHGEVDMTADAVARRTTIPLEVIQKGIIELSMPDPESRTPDHEGRRIVLIDPHRDWGWHIVNYEKYRKIRSEDERREYQRVLMASRREKLASVSNVSPGSKQYAVSSKQETHTPPRVLSTPNFERFFEAYPYKIDRSAALREWVSVPFAEKETETILAGLEVWKSSDRWSEERYVPSPAKFLKNRRWESLPPKKAMSKSDKTKQAIERVRANRELAR